METIGKLLRANKGVEAKRKLYDLVFSGQTKVSSGGSDTTPASEDFDGAQSGLQQIPIVLGKSTPQSFGPAKHAPARTGTPYGEKPQEAAGSTPANATCGNVSG